jgi:hypothetical protein
MVRRDKTAGIKTFLDYVKEAARKGDKEAILYLKEKEDKHKKRRRPREDGFE